MLLDLDSIIYYGRYYSCYENKYENYWWLDLIDYDIYSVDQLISDMGFESYDEICDSVYYIPLFKTDIVAAEKEFMTDYDSKKLARIEKECPSYDAAFKTYIEREHIEWSWFDYERAVLYNDAVLWCKENNIAYRK